MEERARIDEEIARLQQEEADAQAQRAELERQKAAQIAAEEARLKAEQEDIRGSFAGTPATTPQALLDALIQQESGGQHIDPATSGLVTNRRTGARGVAQIMPGTGASPGFGVRPLQNDSEAEHRRFASDYLAAMLERYNGDRRKALAAYNAGPGRVDALIAKHGDAWLSHAPKETRDYVPSVLASADGYDTLVPTGGEAGQRLVLGRPATARGPGGNVPTGESARGVGGRAGGGSQIN